MVKSILFNSRYGNEVLILEKHNLKFRDILKPYMKFNIVYTFTPPTTLAKETIKLVRDN